MRIKEGLNLEVLLNYGFTKINKEEETENEEHYIALCEYKFEIGHARRGQYYYLLVAEKTRDIIIYSTEPDGSGGCVLCPDILIKLSIDGLVEPNLT